MNISIFYLICFLIMIGVLLFVLYNNKSFSANVIILVLVLIIGTGGYYALANAKNLEEAILANKISYVVGIFAPLLLFFIFCEICKIKLKEYLKIILFSIQILLYLSVFTIGTLPIYYQSVSYNCEQGIAFLTKSYGPMHTIYLLSMAIYFIGNIVVSVISKKHKNRVSSHMLSTMVFLEFVIIAVYLVERNFEVHIEFIPFAIMIVIIFIIFFILKINLFSIRGNAELINRKLKAFAYIIFDTHLRYMGCNQHTIEIFPEFLDWQLEEKIPGSGGAFNTFFRLSLIDYANNHKDEEMIGRNFTHNKKHYTYTINTIKNNHKKIKGYIIEISEIKSEEDYFIEKTHTLH